MDYIKFDYFDKLYREFNKEIYNYYMSKTIDYSYLNCELSIKLLTLLIITEIKNILKNKIEYYIKSIDENIYIDKNIEFTEIKSILEDIIYNLNDEEDELKDKLISLLHKYKI